MGHVLKDRKALTNWVLSLENKYPVETWMIDNVNIWAMLRIHIYMYTAYKLNAARNENVTPTIQQGRLSRIKALLYSFGALFRLLVKPLQKGDTFFVGAEDHRVSFNGESINRFFDPLMDVAEKAGNKVYLAEYQRKTQNPSNTYKPYRVLDVSASFLALHFIAKLKRKIKQPLLQLAEYDAFLKELEEKGLSSKEYSVSEMSLMVSRLSVLAWFWTVLIRKTKAIEVYELCFYSESVFALNIACNTLDITSFDLQHGSQGDYHLAYSRYSKLPDKRFFDGLPNVFLCWDDSSTNNILDWITALNAKNKAVKYGNPWIDFLNNLDIPEYNNMPRNILLVTLQPLGKIIDDEVVEAIKSLKDSFSWWVRIHPRQEHQKDELIAILKENNILQYVELDKAFRYPLPLILQNTMLHFTRFSGSAIEAAYLNKKTILLNEIGFETYKDLVQKKIAICYRKEDGPLFELILKTLKNETKTQ